jgi:hypothetical protein
VTDARFSSGMDSSRRLNEHVARQMLADFTLATTRDEEVHLTGIHDDSNPRTHGLAVLRVFDSNHNTTAALVLTRTERVQLAEALMGWREDEKTA